MKQADNSIQLGESVNAAYSQLFNTAASYFANLTPYKIAVSRNYAGSITVYIKGGAYTEWTLVAVTAGTNPITDTTTVTSKYFGVHMEVATKFRLLGIHAGVLGLPELNNLYNGH
jgi:hypothetical protein